MECRLHEEEASIEREGTQFVGDVSPDAMKVESPVEDTTGDEVAAWLIEPTNPQVSGDTIALEDDSKKQSHLEPGDWKGEISQGHVSEDEKSQDEVQQLVEEKNDPSLFTTPPKRPSTAYFLFMEEKRPEIAAQNPGAKIGDIAKLVGAAWNELNEELRVPYAHRALEAKEIYKVAMQAYEKLPKSSKRSSETISAAQDLPLSRVSKIAKLDESVSKLSKESSLALSKACEMFVEYFGEQVYRRNLSRSKKAIDYQAVYNCVHQGPENLDFLMEVTPKPSTKVANHPSKRVTATPETASSITKYFN